MFFAKNFVDKLWLDTYKVVDYGVDRRCSMTKKRLVSNFLGLTARGIFAATAVAVVFLMISINSDSARAEYCREKCVRYCKDEDGKRFCCEWKTECTGDPRRSDRPSKVIESESPSALEDNCGGTCYECSQTMCERGECKRWSKDGRCLEWHCRKCCLRATNKCCSQGGSKQVTPPMCANKQPCSSAQCR